MADHLYQYVRSIAKDKNSFETIKLVIKTMQVLKIEKPLEKQVSKLPTLENVDKAIVLMLCGCGAELKKAVIGDSMVKLKTELPVDETLTMLAELSKGRSCFFAPSVEKKEIYRDE